jgi:hypothetical protein
MITALILTALILASASMLVSPSARAVSSEVKVLSYSWYVAPSNTVQAEYAGDLVAVGEVQNVGSNVLGSVFVVGFAYNSTGTLLDSNNIPIYASNLLPGQKAPFYIDFLPQNSITGDDSWVPSVTKVTVQPAYIGNTTVTQNSGLKLTGVSASKSSGTYTVTGTVKNNGTETTGNVFVDTTFYNTSGTVVALNFTSYLTSSFAPGNSVPFTATPIDNTAQLSSEIINYSLLIQSEPLTTSGSPTPSPSPSPHSSSSTVI